VVQEVQQVPILNGKLRAGTFNSGNYFEAANAIETAQDSGLYQAGYTTYGIHPTRPGQLHMNNSYIIPITSIK
jgi:hypothetical protein